MKRVLVFVGVSAFFVVCVLFMLILWAYVQASHAVAISPSDINQTKVALVLGASVRGNKQPSPVLQDRINAGVMLLRYPGVEKLLLSGDNRETHYNEVAAMRRAAIELGAPSDALVLDFAGRRTYDSCFRAKEIFGLSEVVVVSQRFHLPRAIFLCSKLGLRAQGLVADREGYEPSWRDSMRELMAWVLAIWDVYVRQPTPILGAAEPIE